MIELIESLASGILWAAPCILLAALFSRVTTGSIGKGLLAAYPLFFGSQVVLSKLLGAAGMLARPAMWMAYGAATAAGVFLYLALTAATKVIGRLTEAVRFYVFELGFRRFFTPQVFDHEFLHYGYPYPVLLPAGSAAAIRQVWRRQYTATALVLAKIWLRWPLYGAVWYKSRQHADSCCNVEICGRLRPCRAARVPGMDRRIPGEEGPFRYRGGRGRAENCWCGRAGVRQPDGRSGWEVRWVAS